MKRYIAIILALAMLFPVTVSMASAKSTVTVQLSKTAYVYDGKVKSPSVTVKYGKNTLKNKTDYSVKYPSGRTNVGKYTVTVTLKGKYSGKKTASFKILPAPTKLTSVKGGSKCLTVKWKARSKQVSGYEIQYSSSKSFKSYSTVRISGSSSVQKKISSLKASTKYYVRIRTYKNFGKTAYYSSWSPVMSATTLKASGGSSTGSKTTQGIYITPTGKCYHFSKSCAGKNAISTTYEYAKKYYRACKKCAS